MKVWQIEENQIIWGEAIAALESHVKDSSIDLIFADPPYNIGKKFNGRQNKWDSNNEYIKWCYQWIDLCLRKLKKTGSIYIMAATQYMPYLDIHLRDKIAILSRIIWYYDSSGVQAKKYFGSLYEPILFGVKDRNNYIFNSEEIMVEAKTGAVRKLIDYRKAKPAPYNTQKVPGNVWYIPRVRYRMPEYRNHPTQKPEALLERIIKASSNPGNLILDLFAGTFTTSVVAQRLGRKFISIEIEEEYIKLGLERLDLVSETQNNNKFLKNKAIQLTLDLRMGD